MAGRPRWLWLNLLSLDAPIVALVWQDFAARTFGNPLGWAERAALGLTVWAVYLADRLLDIRTTDTRLNTARHNFYRRHPRVLTALLAAVLVLDSCIALVELRRVVLVRGLAIAACLGAYLATFPLRPTSGWEKQIAAAILFSTGVLLVSSTWVSPVKLLLPGVLFAGLCLCNLLSIEIWERGGKRRPIWLAAAALAGAAGLLSTGGWGRAVAVAGVLLAAIGISGRRVTVDAKRVLADAALLAPLLFR